MESRDQFLDDTLLSELTHTPLACSTAKLDVRGRRFQHNGEKCHVASRLFYGMDEPLSAVLESSISSGDTSIESLPSDSASKRIIIDQTATELPSFLAASKRRLSGLISHSFRQRVGRLLPQNIQHPNDAPSAVPLVQRTTVQNSEFQAPAEVGMDQLLPSFMLPNQDLLTEVPRSPVDNLLVESTALDMPKTFEKCTEGSTILQDPQVHFSAQQISGRSTSVGVSCSAPDKLAEFFQFEHCQDTSLEGEEFCSSGLAEAMLKQDEEKFKEDDVLKGLLSCAPSDTLQDGIGPQDITRPSWMGDGASRVSVGMYMRGRSAPLTSLALDLEQIPTKESKPKSSECLSAESLHSLVLDDLGLDKSALVRGPSSPSASHLTTRASQDESCVQPLSVSTINRVLREISLSEGSDMVSRKLEKAAKHQNPPKDAKPKENVPPGAHTVGGTASLDDGIFKRPFPVISCKKRNSFALNHGSTRHIQRYHAFNCSDLGSGEGEFLSADCLRSQAMDVKKHEGVEKMPARLLDKTRRVAEDPAEGKTGMLPRVGDGPVTDNLSVSVSCGALRTREWVLKSHHAVPTKINCAIEGSQQLLQVSVPCQLPEDKMPASSPRGVIEAGSRKCSLSSSATEGAHYILEKCSVVGSQEPPASAIRSDQLTHNHYEGDRGTCSAGVGVQTGTLPGQEPATVSSTSGSDTGSLCSAMEQAWIPSGGGALVQQHQLCVPSCSSLSSGSDILRPSVMVLPGELSHTTELDLGCVCAGVVKKTALTLINSSQCAMQYTLRWSDCTFDGRVVDGPDFVDITFPKVVAVDGLHTAEVKGNFVSRKPGSVKATIKVQPLRQSSEPSTSLSVSLCALVEWPQLHVQVPQEFEGLEYGGPQRTGTLTVANKGSCTVPLKIMIVEGQGAFSLSSEDVETNRTNVQANAFTIFTSVPAGKDADFNVVCYPQNAKSLCCTAKVQIFLSGTYASTELLESIPMSATIAPPKLSVEEKRGVVTVLDTEEKVVTLKNKGEHCLKVELQCSNSSFAVAPKLAHIESFSSAPVTLVLVDAPPSMDGQLKGVLKAVVHPHGIVLNLVKLEGKLQDGNLSAPHPPASYFLPPLKERMSVLEINKRCILWPGVPVGDSVTKSIVFRNPSSIPMKADLMIQEHHASHFKVSVKGKSSPSHTISCCIQPRESVEVSVTFSPSCVQFVRSILLIGGQGPETLNNKGVHLLGFGGKQKVDLLGLSPLGHGGYIMDMGIPTMGEEVKREFTMFNGGDWDCFVRFSLCEGSPTSDTQLGNVRVWPECLVLKSKESRTVMLSAAIIKTSHTLTRWDQVVKLGLFKVFHGLEVLRQGAKRATAGWRRIPEAVAPFLVKFEGERDSADAVVLPVCAPEDIFLKTVSQTAVVLSCGAATIMMEASSNTSFVPVEDMSCVNNSELTQPNGGNTLGLH